MRPARDASTVAITYDDFIVIHRNACGYKPILAVHKHSDDDGYGCTLTIAFDGVSEFTCTNCGAWTGISVDAY